MNIGVLGTGFGAYHVELLQRNDLVDQVVVFGRNPSKLQKLKDELHVEVTNNLNDIMLDPTIDIIDLCLPSKLHREYAVQALQHGKHVFCETPVCYHLEDAWAMKSAEKQYGKRILVNQFIKFDPAYAYLHEANQKQKYGKLLSLTLKRETPPLWGELGLDSITTNFMIHDLDFLTWLHGSSTDKFSIWGNESPDKSQAIVTAFFQYQDILSHIVVSSQMPKSYPFTVGYEAYFEQAKLVFHESDINGQTQAVLDEYTATMHQELVIESINPYEKSLAHALQCLQDDSESIISLDHAIQSLNLAIELKNQLLQAKDN